MSETQSEILFDDRAGFLDQVKSIRATNAAMDTVQGAVDETIKDMLHLLDQPNVMLMTLPDEAKAQAKGELGEPQQINNGETSLVDALFGIVNS